MSNSSARGYKCIKVAGQREMLLSVGEERGGWKLYRDEVKQLHPGVPRDGLLVLFLQTRSFYLAIDKIAIQVPITQAPHDTPSERLQEHVAAAEQDTHQQIHPYSHDKPKRQNASPCISDNSTQKGLNLTPRSTPGNSFCTSSCDPFYVTETGVLISPPGILSTGPGAATVLRRI